MPFLGAGVIYPLYILLLVRRCYNQAMVWVLWWAVCQSLAVAVATILIKLKKFSNYPNNSYNKPCLISTGLP